MNKIKLLIADDHRIFREGIQALLVKEAGIEIVAEASSADEIYNILESKEIDLVLMDIDLDGSSGIEATRKITMANNNIAVLALSMHSDHSYIMKMLDAGAKGYILKNTGKDEMIAAIKAVYNGASYFSSDVSQKLISQLVNKKRSNSSDIPLTRRETEILRLIAREYSNSEIADELFISIRTVDTHKRNLLEKLGLKNTAGLVKYAIQNGLLND
ncbi:MAG: DNA-binding response regulator [Marinilabiliales bacterium]|nr:MAG: DNA-binding response regulator [Marinilabiliales bacterium]